MHPGIPIRWACYRAVNYAITRIYSRSLHGCIAETTGMEELSLRECLEQFQLQLPYSHDWLAGDGQALSSR